MKTAQTAFWAGNFQQTLQLASAPSAERIGALVFLGQLDQALTEFHSLLQNSEGAIAARFFVGVGLTRVSRYEEARAYFAENLRQIRLRRRSSTGAASEPLIRHRDAFYAAQGVAFYRFFFGRHAACRRWAEQAWQSSLQAKFHFGQALALDLLGHTEIRGGEIRKGLARFESAISIAERLGNGGIASALRVNWLTQRVQFGIEPEEAIARLTEARDSAAQAQNTFTQGELELELARQWILRGEASKARQTLNRICDTIYRHRNQRQAATLQLRFAQIQRMERDSFAALSLVKAARASLPERTEAPTRHQLAAFEYKLCRELGLAESAEDLRNLLLPVWRSTQDARDHRALGRLLQPEASPAPTRLVIRPGEDPLGDLFDDLRSASDARTKRDHLREMIERGWLGLIPDALGIEPYRSAVLLDVLPGSLLLVDRGNLLFIRRGMRGMLRKILERIASRPASKAELIEEIWGYRYSPLRHDPLLYASIAKIRKAFGSYGGWIQSTENGYTLDPQIERLCWTPEGLRRLHLRATAHRASDDADSKSTVLLQALPRLREENRTPFPDLNFRQHQILELLESRSSVATLEVAKHFDVSLPTACRDLSALAQRGMATRVGKGRACRYILPQGPVPPTTLISKEIS